MTGTVRNARPEDFNEVFPLLEQLWADRKLDEDKLQSVFNLSIEAEKEFAFCYIENGQVVGFAAGTIQNDYCFAAPLCYVSVLVVDKKQRGSGIGTKLMDCVKTIASENGCGAVELASGFKREQAHTFYEKYGFERTAYFFCLQLQKGG